MTQEGVRRKENFFNGEYHDELIFGVFREEWEPASLESSRVLGSIRAESRILAVGRIA